MNAVIKELLEKYPHLNQEDIIKGKCITAKGKVYLKHLHKQKDYYSSNDYFSPNACASFKVYCQDETMPVEVDKVLQYLDNSDSCEAYIVSPHESVYGWHDTTLFMPDDLAERSAKHDYTGRWSREWNKAMEICVLGPMADMVNNELITEKQLVQMIRNEVEK